MKRLWTVALVILGFSNNAQAGVIDIDRIGFAGYFSSVGNGVGVGEAFTMGQTGRLDEITVFLNNNRDVPQDAVMDLFTVQVTDSGYSFKLEGSSSIALSPQLWKFESFPFSLNFTAGHRLAFLVRGLGGQNILVMHSDRPGGALLSNVGGDYWEVPFRPGGKYHSLSYSTTITPIPEPSTIVMGLLGISAVVLFKLPRINFFLT